MYIKTLKYAIITLILIGLTACDKKTTTGGGDGGTDTTKPIFTSSSKISVAENQTTALTLKVKDNNTALTYSISGTDKDSFNIDSKSGVITFKNAPDYESGKVAYTFTATVTDTAGNKATQEITISISNVADIVPTLTAFTKSIAENTTISTNIGKVEVSNVGDTSITAFKLSDNTNFEINSSGYIKTKTTFDYDNGTKVYNLTVTATNGAGLSSSVAVTINISNIAETVPTLTELNTSIDEIVKVGTRVGVISVSNSRDTDITAFDLNESDVFGIDANGVITTKAILDYETKAFYHLEVNATNGAGMSIDVDVNITINDINISSAVYDNNATTNTNDDVFNIYLTKDVNASQFSADNGSFIFTPSKTIVIKSEEYNSSWFKYTVHFNTGSEILKDINISLNAGVETAIKIAQINKFSRIKTGQITSYQANDDANLNRGRSQSYTDNSNGTITDNNTALIWQKEDDNILRNYADAITYCTTTLSLGGATQGWRLPTIDELVSITDKGKKNPAINPLFINTNTSFYWSFSSSALSSSYAWGVLFSDGYGNGRNKTDSYYVRCVRDGQ
jgi:hypothetical protein